MSEATPTVSFNLADFPYAIATKFVAETYRPVWIRRWAKLNWFLIFLTIMFGWGQIQWTPVVGISVAMFATGLLGMIFLSEAVSKASTKSLSGSPLRLGTRTVSLDSSGLIFVSPYGQQVLPYTAFMDVLERAGDLLFVTSPYEFLPVPSAAFPSDEARKSFLDAARRHLTEAKREKP